MNAFLDRLEKWTDPGVFKSSEKMNVPFFYTSNILRNEQAFSEYLLSDTKEPLWQRKKLQEARKNDY